MPEIDLMDLYPKSDRSLLLSDRKKVDHSDRLLAQQFGKEYFDGPRHLGLGGYYYNPKYFKPVVDRMIQYYGLKDDASILDIGCAKGFMLHDFKEALPSASLAGIDISEYCLQNSMSSVSHCLKLASCDSLPYPDKSFDLVIAIATIHNLNLEGVKKSIKEINRVSKKHAYIKVNGYKTIEERDKLFEWNLVAKTILHVNEWQDVFEECGYAGDYSWFTP